MRLIALALCALCVTIVAAQAPADIIQIGFACDQGQDAWGAATGAGRGTAPAGWVKWVMPGASGSTATVTKDFAFAPGNGPGGAGTIRITVTSLAGKINDPGGDTVSSAPGYPLEGIIQDDICSAGGGTTAAGFEIDVQGLPAGQTVNAQGIFNESNNYADLFHYYKANTLAVTVNGSSATATPGVITNADPVASTDFPSDPAGPNTNLFTSYSFTSQSGTNAIVITESPANTYGCVTMNALTLQIVPEPATLSLLILGGLAMARRRR